MADDIPLASLGQPQPTLADLLAATAGIAPAGPTPLGSAIMKHLGDLAAAPGRTAAGQQPQTPGMWSDLDEAQAQANARGLQVGAPEAAMMMTGAGGAIPAESNALNMGIKAFHGSPHDFERFDMSKIGTGEGAQAYGHGLYLAENPETAASYRDALTARHNPSDQQYGRFLTGSDEKAPGEFPPEGLDLHLLRKMGEERKSLSNDELLTRAQDNLASVQNTKGPLGEEASQRAQATIDYLKATPSARYVGTPYEGRMYEVNINADPEHFLDWDKPLSEQHPKVQAAAEASGIHSSYAGPMGTRVETNTPMGELANRQLTERQSLFLKNLQEADIPGIKYLDQGSRGSGAGTSNYVVFDDNLISILKKYGLAGLIGAGAMASPAVHDPASAQQ